MMLRKIINSILLKMSSLPTQVVDSAGTSLTHPFTYHDLATSTVLQKPNLWKGRLDIKLKTKRIQPIVLTKIGGSNESNPRSDYQIP